MDPDLVVIGGGAAGISTARTAARRGALVALVQNGPVGGDCTFVGCVPSKTLIHAAADGLDFPAATARVRATVGRIAATETADVLRAEGIDVVEGSAQLLAANRLRVGDRELRAPRLVLAVGSEPVLPSVPGLDRVDVLTNETVFELSERPTSLAVIGGGPIGVELAQAFARLGSEVTVVEAAGRLLPSEEAEASDVVRVALAGDGVRVLTGRQVASARPEPNRAGLRLDDGTEIGASKVLVAVGRRAATEGLGLDAAGVALDERGFVRTDDRLRTNVSGIWAAGDIVGRSQLTHAAYEMGRVTASNALSRLPYRRFRDSRMPAVTFTDPEVARVGLTEEAAAERGARVVYLPMSEVDRAVAAGRTAGYIKLVVGRRRATGNLGGGRLLGATVVAARAGEMIHAPTLAMRSGMFPARLALATTAYPTWSLAVQQAAGQLFLSTGRQPRPAGSATRKRSVRA